MAVTRTFSIIKPDATRRNLTGKVNAVFEENGLRIVAQKRIQMTRAQAETFYGVHRERGFFKEQNIETEMTRLIGGPPNVAAMITPQLVMIPPVCTKARRSPSITSVMRAVIADIENRCGESGACCAADFNAEIAKNAKET